MPFRFIEVTGWEAPKGDVYLCCPNWLKTPIGNMLQSNTFRDIWNGDKARDVRRTILDGSFKYCNQSLCPFLQTVSGTVKRRGEIADAELIEIIKNNLTTLPQGPREIRCSYDKSCNLSCPTCRTEVIVEHAYESQIWEIQNKLQHEALADAHIVSITGSGDPFGSPFNRKWLQTMRKKDMPRLKNIHIHTNAQLWTQTMWKTIPKEIQDLVLTTEISIDAANPETYVVNRRGGRFERLVENLDFISSLRKKGPLHSVTISMVVQNNNFREMPNFVRLGQRFGFDVVSFGRLVNWGTFSEEEFTTRAIHRPSHPNHQEFRQVLENEVLYEPISYLGNLSEFLK
jgi:molybdenum cofactor biosynthesis enzyme MoaA